MYEHITFDSILSRMLGRVSDSIDKREGSIIYDACAPAAAELAQMYMELDLNYSLSFADTAAGEYLSRRTTEFGVNRKPATKAVRKGMFYGNADMPVEVSLGSRFSIDNLVMIATARMEAGIYRMESETAGSAGNQKFGVLLPIDYVQGLVRAELADVLVPGEDEESDEVLRQRYYEAVNEPAFGGNIADYKQKINALDGVGGTKIFPVWNGRGTVKATIIAADWSEPTETLISNVQQIVDPVAGQGYGSAPIDHVVTVTGAQGRTINIETTVTLAANVTVAQVKSDVETVLETYFLELRQDWANQTQLVVRIAQIDARILNISGINDVQATKLNGAASNVLLAVEEIPEFGTVVVHA
ncbi:baseplate J/gp47 family protein [Paenibacillus nasutitermitis]|uniref:Phage tail protein n=1 Tax=Paenibacillus nasutitermitis TaxID=1652958 RepID=A0A917E248_9BACL|nr:baseplate J/gp47 family protein [Paenibacillus nasutitermitis]GGD95202.1 phage tail protein [Paenibacillus nasutitermitis]